MKGITSRLSASYKELASASSPRLATVGSGSRPNDGGSSQADEPRCPEFSAIGLAKRRRWSIFGCGSFFLVCATSGAFFHSAQRESSSTRVLAHVPAVRRSQQNRLEWASFGHDTSCHIDSALIALSGRDMKNVIASSAEDCEQQCDEERGLCMAIEYAFGLCSLWRQPVRNFETKPGHTCAVRVPIGRFTTLSNSACRLDRMDQSLDAQGTAEVVSGIQEHACRALCRTILGPECTGIEYMPEHRRCEIWRRPITYHVSNWGSTCSRFRLEESPGEGPTTTTESVRGFAEDGSFNLPSDTMAMRELPPVVAASSVGQLGDADSAHAWNVTTSRSPTTPTACHDPICSVEHWEGWGMVFPWLVTTTTTSTTTTTTTTITTSTTTSTSTTSTFTGTSTTTTTTSVTTTSTTTSMTTTTTVCKTAEADESCYQKVFWAMTSGIAEHPLWYSGLSQWSPFEAFQEIIYKDELGRNGSCHKPCACHTAQPGERCHKNVVWAMLGGIYSHPDWYPGLRPESRFEDFQALLHKLGRSHCPMPCQAPFWGDPSLFCFSISRVDGYEPGIMREQLERSAGIFGCDEFAVLSNTYFRLGEGARGIVDTVKFPSARVGVSKDHTAANTQLFIGAWNKVQQATHWIAHDWTVKVDPDAVMVPDRLRYHLQPFTGGSSYVRNCNAYPESGDFPMMYGSMEAISKLGMIRYFKQWQTCEHSLQWQSWGEDFFMGKCLRMIGVQPVDDFRIVTDAVCTHSDCGDAGAAAFHPFKTKDSWVKCWLQATAARRETTVLRVLDQKSHESGAVRG